VHALSGHRRGQRVIYETAVVALGKCLALAFGFLSLRQHLCPAAHRKSWRRPACACAGTYWLAKQQSLPPRQCTCSAELDPVRSINLAPRPSPNRLVMYCRFPGRLCDLSISRAACKDQFIRFVHYSKYLLTADITRTSNSLLLGSNTAPGRIAKLPAY